VAGQVALSRDRSQVRLRWMSEAGIGNDCRVEWVL
jgi:hypothetical protein